MRYRGDNSNTVFILGAGATRGAVKHVLVDQKRLKPPLNGDFFDVAATFARARGVHSSEAQRLGRLLRFFKTELPVRGKPSMEDAFSLLYVVKDFPEIYVRGPGRRSPPGKRQELNDFLFLAFQILCTLESNFAQKNGYDRLVSCLGPTDTILTLNYDTLLDSALVKAGWDLKKGYDLAGNSTKYKWQVSRAARGIDLKDVRLLKLHGSLNWFVRGSLANISAVFEKKPVRITQPRSNEISNHLRQIIPPIYGKVFKHAHWRGLWRSAYKALCEADTIVVVGCSLVDTDFHLRALISRVRRYRKEGKPFRRAFFVDHSLKVRRKWMKAFKGATKKMISVKGLNAFLRKELKI